MFGKKAELASIALIIVIIVVIIYAIVVNAVKECRTDTQCGENKYCGSDFKCHEMKVINQDVTHNEYHLWKASLILGAAIVIAAIILKWKRN